MLPVQPTPAPEVRAVAPPDRCAAALQLLADAHAQATAAGLPVWEFALELTHLMAAGLTPTDLRWLCLRGWVEHARETTRPASACRTFERVPNLALGGRDCFVIAAAGRAAFAPPNRPWLANGGMQVVPTWDARTGELRWGEAVVKRFRRPARNQTTILAAFEEDGWPPAIDDPLPQRFSVDPKQRLHDAIKCLNRRMAQRVIQFSGDGSGEGVRWRSHWLPI
jgi:hypothetical protein